MSQATNSSPILRLPIDLLYRIFDQLTPVQILLSLRNVCEQLNSITNSYHPYQVNIRILP